jgi:diguanylate cyclase
VRSRLGEWKRGGETFAVGIARIGKADDPSSPPEEPARSEVLRMAGREMTGTLREMDIVGAYSASSLAVLLPRTGRVDAVGVAERIHKRVAECLAGRSQPVALSVSLGWAEVTDGDDLVRLFERADSALEAAAAAGGDTCYWHNGQWPEPVGRAAVQAC